MGNAVSHADRLIWYRDERDKALNLIADITDNGRTVYDFDGGGLIDGTARRLAYLKKRAKIYERLIRLCEQNDRAHFRS